MEQPMRLSDFRSGFYFGLQDLDANLLRMDPSFGTFKLEIARLDPENGSKVPVATRIPIQEVDMNTDEQAMEMLPMFKG